MPASYRSKVRDSRGIVHLFAGQDYATGEYVPACGIDPDTHEVYVTLTGGAERLGLYYSVTCDDCRCLLRSGEL